MNRAVLVVVVLWCCTACDKAELSEVFSSAAKEVSAREVLVSDQAGMRRLAVTLSTGQGAAFEATLRLPTHPSRPRLPAILLLAGFETGRSAVDLVPARDDVIVMGVDYPAHGLRGLDDVRALQDLQALTAVGYDALRAATAATSYLSDRADVDVDRLIVVGVSFGSLVAVPLVALDPRCDALVLIYGGGDLPHVVKTNLGDAGPWYLPSWALPTLVRVTIGQFEPLDRIAAISPRPLLMIHSTEDRYFPPASAKALFDAAGEPKRLVWLSTEHMALFEPEVLRLVTGQVLDELGSLGVIE